MKKIISFIITIVCATSICAVGQDADSIKTKPIRPVISSYMVDLGKASVLDTYLSPIKYHGVNLRLGYERLQAMRFNPEKWIMQLDASLNYMPVKNPAGNHNIYSLLTEFKWGMMHKWAIKPKLNLMFGGSTQFKGGVLYSPGNSNNVVSVKIRWCVNITGMAVYNIKLWKLPLTLRYQATLPVFSVFFSPDYGESFYEIYVGNRSGLVNFGWWGNRFDMENLFTTDIHLGNTVLRMGYRNTVNSSWIMKLNTQIYTNSFVLGLGGEWMSLRSNKSLNSTAKVISAMY